MRQRFEKKLTKIVQVINMFEPNGITTPKTTVGYANELVGKAEVTRRQVLLGAAATVALLGLPSVARAGQYLPANSLIDVSTLILHGETDQLVPIADTAVLTAKIIGKSTLKIYPDAPHGMTVTQADKVNQDLLTFFKA